MLSPCCNRGLLVVLVALSGAALADAPSPRRLRAPTASPAQWKRAKTIHPAMVQRYCRTEGPETYAVMVFKDRGGDIGGYQVSTSIMDSPVHYFDAAGAPLTMFHIFGDQAERVAAQRIIKALREAFPLQERLRCPFPANTTSSPMPAASPQGK